MEATPAIKRMLEQADKANYTDLEIIHHLSRFAMEHAKTCQGCMMEGLLYSAAGRIGELSPNMPKDFLEKSEKLFNSLEAKE